MATVDPRSARQKAVILDRRKIILHVRQSSGTQRPKLLSLTLKVLTHSQTGPVDVPQLRKYSGLRMLRSSGNNFYTSAKRSGTQRPKLTLSHGLNLKRDWCMNSRPGNAAV